MSKVSESRHRLHLLVVGGYFLLELALYLLFVYILFEDIGKIVMVMLALLPGSLIMASMEELVSSISPGVAGFLELHLPILFSLSVVTNVLLYILCIVVFRKAKAKYRSRVQQ